MQYIAFNKCNIDMGIHNPLDAMINVFGRVNLAILAVLAWETTTLYPYDHGWLLFFSYRDGTKRLINHILFGFLNENSAGYSTHADESAH